MAYAMADASCCQHVGQAQRIWIRTTWTTKACNTIAACALDFKAVGHYFLRSATGSRRDLSRILAFLHVALPVTFKGLNDLPKLGLQPDL